MNHNPNIPVVDAFWVGPQKAASTWAYKCFKEHPDICVPENTSNPYFFDINYFRGFQWYIDFYSHCENESVLVDTTMTYLRSPFALSRIYKYNPEAKIISCLRNPIERAFSHYWHEKKKKKISFQFREIFENYDLFQSWIESGFYYYYLKNYIGKFGRDRVLVMLMDDLIEDNHNFIRRVFEFLDVNPDFKPTVLDKRVNVAGYVQDWKFNIYKKTLSFFNILGIRKSSANFSGRFFIRLLKHKLLNKSEYQLGMDPKIRKQLKKVFKPNIKKLEKLIDRDLSNWIKE